MALTRQKVKALTRQKVNELKVMAGHYVPGVKDNKVVEVGSPLGPLDRPAVQGVREESALVRVGVAI